MNGRHLTALATALGMAAAALAAFSAPIPTPGGAPSSTAPAQLTQTRELYSEKCSACHNLPDPVAQARTRRQWQRTVNLMLTRYGASDSITPDQAAQIVDYLATFAPPPTGGRMQDPWATDQMDVWTNAPTVSRVFNFETPGSLGSFSALSAGTPGPAPAWHLVLESPSPDGTAALVRLPDPTPSRFGLLVDRTDQGHNLDVQVRFHIIAGKVSPAVGIAFGFTGPKSYSVLVYNQTRNDLSLVQVAGPTHTTLQQTPIILPPTPGVAPITAAQTAPTPAAGWHTLRLLVNDGQVRGWLNQTKRINIADPGYQGGKIGLWAQGDTVAAFDDWTVDIYDGAPQTGSPSA